jgi:hypothetical protein
VTFSLHQSLRYDLQMALEPTDREYLALRTEAILRHGTARIQLTDLLSHVMWKESSGSIRDIPSLCEELRLAVMDYAVLHRKNVDLEALCRKIEITEREGRISFNLPAEVVAWLQTR